MATYNTFLIISLFFILQYRVSADTVVASDSTHQPALRLFLTDSDQFLWTLQGATAGIYLYRFPQPPGWNISAVVTAWDTKYLVAKYTPSSHQIADLAVSTQKNLLFALDATGTKVVMINIQNRFLWDLNYDSSGNILPPNTIDLTSLILSTKQLTFTNGVPQSLRLASQGTSLMVGYSNTLDVFYVGGTSTNPNLYLYIQDTTFGALQIDHYENGGVAYGFAASNGGSSGTGAVAFSVTLLTSSPVVDCTGCYATTSPQIDTSIKPTNVRVSPDINYVYFGTGINFDYPNPSGYIYRIRNSTGSSTYLSPSSLSFYQVVVKNLQFGQDLNGAAWIGNHEYIFLGRNALVNLLDLDQLDYATTSTAASVVSPIAYNWGGINSVDLLNDVVIDSAQNFVYLARNTLGLYIITLSNDYGDFPTISCESNQVSSSAKSFLCYDCTQRCGTCHTGGYDISVYDVCGTCADTTSYSGSERTTPTCTCPTTGEFDPFPQSNYEIVTQCVSHCSTGQFNDNENICHPQTCQDIDLAQAFSSNYFNFDFTTLTLFAEDALLLNIVFTPPNTGSYPAGIDLQDCYSNSLYFGVPSSKIKIPSYLKYNSVSTYLLVSDLQNTAYQCSISGGSNTYYETYSCPMVYELYQGTVLQLQITFNINVQIPLTTQSSITLSVLPYTLQACTTASACTVTYTQVYCDIYLLSDTYLTGVQSDPTAYRTANTIVQSADKIILELVLRDPSLRSNYYITPVDPITVVCLNNNAEVALYNNDQYSRSIQDGYTLIYINAETLFVSNCTLTVTGSLSEHSRLRQLNNLSPSNGQEKNHQRILSDGESNSATNSTTLSTQLQYWAQASYEISVQNTNQSDSGTNQAFNSSSTSAQDNKHITILIILLVCCGTLCLAFAGYIVYRKCQQSAKKNQKLSKIAPEVSDQIKYKPSNSVGDNKI